MNAKLMALTGALAGSLLWGTAAANADTVSIGYSINGGGITLLTSGTGTAAYSGSLGSDFNTSSLTGTGSSLTLPPAIFDSSSIAVGKTTDNAESIQIYVTDQGITNPSSVPGFLSKFSDVSVLNGSLTESTYFSAGNALWTGTSLASAATFPTNVGTAGPFSATNPGVGYSLTEEYNFAALTGGGSFNADMEIQSTPLPAALPLFAGGLGLIGLIGRRRKRTASSFAA